MPSLIRDRAASTAEMIAVFDDAALIAAALAFEAALARAEAAEGLIGAEAAAAIEAATSDFEPDVAELAESAAHAGTLAISLVAALRARLKDDPAAAKAVHLGATSQDVADTALVLQAKTGLGLIRRDLAALAEGLAALAERHASTPILGRTLLQPALPITFGLKAAGWLAAVDEAETRLAREAAAALVLQFGGAAGTLAGLDGRALAIADRLGADLDLAVPALPWHARRGGLAGLAAALAIVTCAVAKVARDVALMSQAEVGEAFEPRVEGRGGSSAMPHKHNSTGCQVALSAAVRAPHLAASIISALPQEHERGLGGWQAEAPVLAELFLVAHGAVAAMRDVVLGLDVREDAMARNLAAAGVGEDPGAAQDLVRRALDAHRAHPTPEET